MLFRVAFMVEQKDVGNVYARLAGLKLFRVEAPEPVVVENGTAKMNGIVSLEGRTQITAKEISSALVAAGRSARSTGYVVKSLISSGKIKTSKKRGVYTVIGASK